tara:strand:+ start:42 stop:485 length:444 start_codon:yes stop_codon:yes gene_type:complete
MNKIISIDPGRDKCGMLLADLDKNSIIDGKVVDSKSVINLIKRWQISNQIQLILLGNGTTSKLWKDSIEFNCSLEVKVFNEESTTLRARNRYWELWPRKHLLRLLPKGLLIPSENLDAVAALILLEDYLKVRFIWAVKKDFKTWHES